MKFAIVSDRIVFDEYPGGIIKEHRIPSEVVDNHMQEEVLDLVRRLAKKLEINNGPCYCQIKLDVDNNPVILEVAPRLDGCHMWNLIKHCCGVDLLDACFSHLLFGERVLDEVPHDKPIKHSLIFNCQETGSSFQMSKHDISNAKSVYWYYQDGDSVRKVNGFIEK